MLDHAQLVLGGILPAAKDRLFEAASRLTADHFRVPAQRDIFKTVVWYYEHTGGVIASSFFSDVLQRKDMEPEKVLLYEQVFKDAAAIEVTDDQYKYAIDALIDLHQKHATGEAIATAFEILERGARVDNAELRGHEDARKYLYSNLGEIDNTAAGEDAPEGDLREETDEILEVYLKAKENDDSGGVLTGIESIDSSVGGLRPGDLALIAAFTGNGKSMFSVQSAWEAAVMQGKNVYYATSETVREQIMRRLIVRHSRHPKFAGADPLNSDHVKKGVLDEKGEKFFREVLEDLKTCKDYGKLHIVQITSTATLGTLEANVRRQQQNFDIDLLVIDYLNLLQSDVKRNSEREEANMILKGAKKFATSAHIPILSPWQMSREAWNKAKEQARYELASLSDTSETEKSADLILSLYRKPERPTEGIMQVLKCRDSDPPSEIKLELDYSSTYLGEIVDNRRSTGLFGVN